MILNKVAPYVLEQTHLEVYVADTSGNIIGANPKATEVLGYSNKELMTKHIWDIDGNMDAAAWEAAIRSFTSGSLTTLESTHVRKDGSRYPVEVTITLLNIEGKQYFCGFAQDITERKQTEQALKESQDRLAIAAKASYDLLYEWDVATDTLTWYGDIDAFLGFEPGEISRDISAWLELIHPDDRSRLADAVDMRRASADPIRYEYRIRRKDGRYRYWKDHGLPMLDAAHRPYRWIGVCADVTEQKQLMEQYRNIFEQTGTGMAIIEADGTFSLVNRTFMELAEGTEAELIGRSFLDGVAETDRERLQNYHALRMKGDDVPLRYEFDYRSVKGRTGTVLLHAVFLPESRQTLISAIDITQQKASENVLRHNERMLALSQMIAHLGSWELDLARNTLLWSDEVYRIFEIDPDRFDTSYDTFIAMIHPADRELVERTYSESVRDKTPYIIDHRILMKDGRIKYVQERGTTEYDAAGKPITSFGTILDITERKQAELALEVSKALTVQNRNELQQRERELNAIIEALPLMLFVKDAETLRFVRFNAAGETLLGQSREALFGKNDYDLFEPEQADDFTARDRKVLESRQPLDIPEESIATPRGTRLLHTRKVAITDENGNAKYLLGISDDITDRKEAEQKILESSQRYQAVLNTTRDGFWMVDTRGNILEVNEAYCRMSGYTKEELYQIHISDLEAQQSAEEIAATIEHVKEHGNALFESAHRRKDGGTWPVEVSISYSALNGGSYFSILRDISERKRSDRIMQLREQLADLVYQGSQEQLLQTALDRAEQLTDSQIGFFHFVEKDQDNVSLQVWSTNTLKKMCFAEGAGMHYPISKAGVWVDCIHRREPVIHNDYASLPHKKGMPEGHAELVRELTVPLFRNNLIIAVVGVGNKAQDYTEEDIHTVQLIGEMAYDYVERHRTEQQVSKMAYFDMLTGLPNRSLLRDRINQAAAQARRNNTFFAICYLDLDGFKPVNDRYGHHVGDTLLIMLAKRLQESLREGDTLARLGGDEFALVLTALPMPYECTDILQRILDLINVPFNIEGNRIHISGSIGVTIYPTDDADSDALLRHADQAMYQAKESGKSAYKIYDAVEDTSARLRKQTLEAFGTALQHEELVLHYQPKIDLRSGRVIGMEALVRWEHPERGMLFPGEFLPVIENTPHEIALGEWVTRTALDQLMQWQETGHSFSLSINISPRHIQMQGFADFLTAMLSNYPKTVSNNLELEILEIAAIADMEQVAGVMGACTALGIRFSLDDFGTGYSSLTHFHRLPIDILKIDQNFVKDILTKNSDLHIVEGVLRLAETLQRPVVAEGVESLEIGMMLLYLGCRYGQGYGIARPMSAEAVTEWLEVWNRGNDWHNLAQSIEANDAHYDLNVMIYSRHKWIEQIVAHIKDPDHCNLPSLDEKQCQFTQWYKGIGRTRYGTCESYAFLQERHFKLHEYAIRLNTLMEAGKRDEALAELNHFYKLGSSFESLLKTLAQQAPL